MTIFCTSFLSFISDGSDILNSRVNFLGMKISLSMQTYFHSRRWPEGSWRLLFFMVAPLYKYLPEIA